MKTKRGKNKIHFSKKAISRSYLEDKKNILPKSKRSQEVFGLSFGMIFAIILAIFFIILAIIVINSFISMQNCSKIGIFIKELNDKVDSVWNSNDASVEYVGYLPSAIQYVCFVNLTESFIGKNSAFGTGLRTFNHKYNFFFYPTKESCDLAGQVIAHLDTPQITRNENPFCIKVQNGKTSMMINKENGPLVTITR